MKQGIPQKLILVYNADSGIRNLIFDGAHKILSPSSYQCSLCNITYGAFREYGIWKKFRIESNLQMEFLHKDEFAASYKSKFGHKFSFPIILQETNNVLEVLIKTEELDAIGNAKELICLIEMRTALA